MMIPEYHRVYQTRDLIICDLLHGKAQLHAYSQVQTVMGTTVPVLQSVSVDN